MLDALLQPQAVAVLGASRHPHKYGHQVLQHLQAAGFAGPLLPINPAACEILGLACYKQLRDAPARADLAVICLPAPAVCAAAEQAIHCGVRALVVLSAGFREAGPTGAHYEQNLTQMCRSFGARLLGPNSLGLVNTHHRLNASLARHLPPAGGLAILSQSGALLSALVDWAEERCLGMSKLVSLGNAADLAENDLLAMLAQDEQTRVIAGHLESIQAGERFVQAAETAAAAKPVILLKAGTTSQGGQAASSHTGSLMGADLAYGAAFRRAGVIRADSAEDLIDYAMAFSLQPLPRGNRLMVLTNGAGPGILAADEAERAGLRLVVPSRSCATPAALVSPFDPERPRSPLVVFGDAGPERYLDALSDAQTNPDIDAVLLVLAPQVMSHANELLAAMASLAVPLQKPVLMAVMSRFAAVARPTAGAAPTAVLPVYPSPERAVRCLRAMLDYATWRQRPPRIVRRFRVNRRRVHRIFARQMRTGRLQIGEVGAKEILRAYGFCVPPGEVCSRCDEALEVADRIGYPVALKIVSPDFPHKSDVGGVKLDLNSPEVLADAFELMMLRIRQRYPEAQIEGVYVERMAPRGREVILGMSRDAKLGPLLMFGLGGIFVEVMKDVAFHLAPITADEAMQMLQKTRSFALLQGARGQSPIDSQAIAEALQRISQLVTDHPEILELDINPLVVGAPGCQAVAVDARMTLRGGGQA